MATLVFSTVGNALGGPVGGAIGALIGQSFDQQLLGGPRKGPRVGDLTVQTSTYGTQIPRIYGAMRVAGSVAWATDLIETEQTNGAKGQPDVSYSYSVSLAVALSSRAAAGIGRIWADGQLLRGAAGDLKVPGTFRFYGGSEDQAIDPLIASIEGIANTPAYRGAVVAVFEDLALATFGNRIPFMTFEVLADSQPIIVASILSDASEGAISSNSTDAILGYAVYGASVADAVQPLVSAFDVRLFDDGTQLRSPATAEPVQIDDNELGSGIDPAGVPVIERERQSPDRAPGTLRLNYYDPSRDYQAGEARAASGATTGSELHQELPVAIAASDAKALAHRAIAREWSGIERARLRLPPMRVGLEPGVSVQTSVTSGSWIVDKATVEGFVTIAELRRGTDAGSSMTADGGRAIGSVDVVEGAATLALLDIPNVIGSVADTPVALVAAATSTSGWRARSVTIAGAGLPISGVTAARKSILGTAETVLGEASADLLDTVNFVEVQLVDGDQWLTSCDHAGLGSGANLALVGSELVQFATATSLGGGRFRLERLLRGRAGSDWASGGHVSGEVFCMLERDKLAAFEMPLTAVGAHLTVEDTSGAAATAVFAAEWVRPLSPSHLSVSNGPDGGLDIRWIRRSRCGSAWLDEIDAPLGESAEQYRVTLTGTAGEAELTTDVPELTVAAAELASLGSGALRVDIRQVGDCAVSRASSINITL